MTVTLETLGEQRAQAARRQRAGVLNRFLGWVILPMVIAAVYFHYAPGGRSGTYNDLVKYLHVAFVPLVFVHLGLSVYVFGLVRPARTLRVFHIWFGYAYILLVLTSQTTFNREPLHAILSTVMFTCLTIHVAIGVFYAMRRRQARVERMPIGP